MKDLSRHIEYLLLERDCVIIPQLGAFVARHLGSEFSQEENLFIPPYRLVHFNSQLVHDDQVLTNSIAKTYHISTNEAAIWCQEFVTLIHEELLINGTYDFGTIGLLYKENELSPISFSSCKAGVTTPELYGLDSFQISMLTAEERTSVIHEKKQEKETIITSVTQDDKHITIRLNKRVLEYVAAVAACIVLFFSFSTPSGNTDAQKELSANTEFFIPRNLIPQGGMPEVKSVDLDMEEVNTPVEEKDIHEAEIVETKEDPKAIETEKEPKVVENPLGKYAIVLSSAVSNANAENFVNSLNKRGINAQVYNNGKLNRVIIAGFQNEKDARTQMRSLKASDSQFKDAWMMTF